MELLKMLMLKLIKMKKRLARRDQLAKYIKNFKTFDDVPSKHPFFVTAVELGITIVIWFILFGLYCLIYNVYIVWYTLNKN